jgi:hypothetical protein
VSEAQNNIATVVKEFFEDALVDGTPFDMGDIYEYVTSKVPDAKIGDLDKVLKKLAEKGEVKWSLHDGTNLCVAEKPEQAQSTLFGTASSPDSPKKRKPFTKKQKAEALEVLGGLNPLPPGLERLHDWLFEQVYGGPTP